MNSLQVTTRTSLDTIKVYRIAGHRCMLLVRNIRHPKEDRKHKKHKRKASYSGSREGLEVKD